ncbi:MAG: AI-2E family transporter [Sphingobacteriia bacterium]|nr:AI-2E family transporter [Sphingobacteriia bacterium]
MDNLQQPMPTRQIVQLLLQLLALIALFSWCFYILQPFITPVLWGGILAVVFYPLHQSFSKKLNNRATLAAVIITLLLLALLIVPGIWLGFKTANEIAGLTNLYNQGKLIVPPPTEQVKDWPLVGKELYGLWKQASDSIETFVLQYPETIKKTGSIILSLIASTGTGIVLFAFSIIICGVFLTYSNAAADFATLFLRKLSGSKKMDLAAVSALILRNVVKGILLVALIQSVLATVSFVLVGLPAAALWSVACLVSVITQIGVLPVAIPAMIYVWTHNSTWVAVVFTASMVLISILDNILKPLFLGKGSNTPMLVIFLGSIGGFLFSGFSGLFTGAVVLSLGYQLFIIWVEGTEI